MEIEQSLLKKPICIVLHGNSCEILEEQIQNFKDKDIVWASMSSFDIPQTFILNKINKKFSIVFDSSTVKNEREYELTIRLPRLINYLSQNENNIYICTKSDKNNLFELRNKLRLTFNDDYKKQIIYTEDIGIDPNPFCVSLHLYIACLSKLGFKKIILFGADGGGKKGNSIESYYKHEEVKIDKELCGNVSYNMIGDSNNINSTFEPLMKKVLGYIPEVYNCSPDSLYNVFKKTNYMEVLNLIS